MDNFLVFRRATLLFGIVAAIAPGAVIESSQAPNPDASAARTLEMGPGLQGTLRPPQSQTYQFRLSEGEYAEVVVQQRGVDARLRLVDPSGQRVIEVDRSTGMRGDEPLHWIAETAGTYRLEVVPVRDDAPAGQYEIRMRAVRAPNEHDATRIAAQAGYAAAKQLRSQNNKAALDRAIERLTETAIRFDEATDRVGTATAWLEMSQIHSLLGNMKASAECGERAIAIFRTEGDRYHEGLALIQTGEAYRFVGDVRKGLGYYERALVVLQPVADPAAEGMALADLGDAYFVLHDLQRALSYDYRALPLIREAGTKDDLGTLLNNFGAIFRNLGEPEKALEYYLQALPLVRAVTNTNLEAVLLDNIGVAYLTMNEPAKALEFFNQSLPLRQALGNKRGEAVSYDNIASSYQHMGQPARALEYANKALPLIEAIGDRYKRALVLNNIGVDHYHLGDRATALDYYTRALALFEDVGDPLEQAKVHKNIAAVKRDDGRFADARSHIEHAIVLSEFIRSHAGSQERRASYAAMMTDHFDFYVALLMAMHDAEPGAGHDREAFQVAEQARGRSLLELLSQSYADIRQGVDAELLQHEHDLADQLTAALDKLTKLQAGARAAEQKAVAQKEVASLTDQYQHVQAEIRERSPRFAALTQPEPLSTGEIQQQILDADTMLLEYRLGSPHSYLWAVTQDRVISAALPSRNEIDARARRVYELLTARQSRRSAPAGSPPSPESHADGAYASEAAALSQILLGPVAAQLGNHRLVIVADGALQYLPFSALPIPASASTTPQVDALPLVTQHEITSAPSASVLAVIMRELAGRPPATKAVAVIADPVFNQDDARVKSRARQRTASARETAPAPAAVSAAPLDRAVRNVRGDLKTSGLGRLLFSRDEANGILAVTPATDELKAFDFLANRALVMSKELDQYRIIHFATHGLVDSRQPDLSGLVLSLVDDTGRPQDGFLRLHEIYNLKLKAELVVLSACQTALGRDVRGEGLIGLTRGFMYAGARRVVASLWEVDDAATAQLMKAFYRGMMEDKMSPATALRAAQLEIQRKPQWRAPYYWAAFVLQGDWRDARP